MTLTFSNYDVVFQIVENKSYEFVIEKPQAFSDVLGEIWQQINGDEGNIIIAENEKIINLAKCVDVIWNPFALNCNDKKILNKLYAEMVEVSNEKMQETETELNSMLVRYLDKLTASLPYNVSFGMQMDLINLFKMYKLELCVEEYGVLERIIEYIKAMNRICNINFFIAVNLKQYLSEDEMNELVKFISYEKVVVFVISGCYTYRIENENICILDKDLCKIEI